MEENSISERKKALNLSDQLDFVQKAKGYNSL